MPQRPAPPPAEASSRESPRHGFASILLHLWQRVVFLLLLIAGGMWAWSYYSVRESTDDARIDGHVAPVSARVAGNIIGILVEENDAGEAGQVLARSMIATIDRLTACGIRLGCAECRRNCGTDADSDRLCRLLPAV